MRKLSLLLPALALALAFDAGSALAQAGGNPKQPLTIRQVQDRFHHMTSVHILKCDYNGDGLIEPGAEYQCVAGIYRVMYVNR